MRREIIDLHTHSNISDGSDSPAQLISKAYNKGIRAVALTDHDTIAGLAEASETANTLGIEFIRGVELSAKVDASMFALETLGASEVHILGLFLPENTEQIERLEITLVELREKRDQRNQLILEKLQNLGIDIYPEEIFNQKKSKAIGRPHFAKLLIKKGVAKNYTDAFARYLGKNGQAYVSKAKLDTEDAIKILRELGAVVSLAHPLLNFNKFEELESIIPQLKDFGLQAIEAYHTEQSSYDTKRLIALAEKYNLKQTGGSDYHGVHKLKVQLGTGKGSLYVPYSVLEDLRRLQ